MELPSWASFVLAAALFLSAATTLLLLQRRSGQRGYKRYRLPPGPKPWPVIGNLHLMGALPHRSIRDLSARYGPLMQLRFGSIPVVVGSSPEMARLLLQTHDAALAGRPRTAAGRHTAYDHTDMLWSSYGAHWRRLRRVCLAELFSASRIASYETVRHDEVRALLRGLHAAAATSGLGGGGAVVVVVREHLFAATLGMISRMVLGRKYVEAAGSSSASGIITPEEFTRTMDEFFFLNGALNIGDFVPWLDGLDLQGYVGRMRRVGATLDVFMERVLDEHVDRRRRADGEGHASPCMVDVLLELADGDRLERDSVKALTLDLIAGGTNTNGVTLEWAISELLRNPKMLARATEELDRVVGPDRLVTERDVSDLPYMKAAVKETMRMHPVGPLLAPHEALEDVSIGGYDIPSGTRVLVNVWAIARDGALWDMPEEFRPERFLGKSKIDVVGQDFELLPFGSGRRMCPGYKLGLKVVHICLANMLHCFVWRLPVIMAAEKLSMDEIFGLTTSRKIPLEVFIKPKLSSHLYVG
uniref:Uncharacterized protein n=1 Tax=Avena sativa TaxID=4498 RepID=A0ACD6ABF2_AVESA